MSNIVQKLEQVARGICFFCHFGFFSAFIIIEALWRSFIPGLDKCLQWFSADSQNLRNVGELLAKLFLKGFFDVLGINIITEYRTPLPKNSRENCIVMFSHGSNLDPPVIGATWPNHVNFVAKKSLFKVPLLGLLFKIVGAIPINRENLSEAKKSLDIAANIATGDDRSIGIAPEGTRRRSDSIGPEHLLPLKKGPFHLAKKSYSDIVPAAIIGANRLFPPNQMLPKAGTLIVRYMEKIPKEVVQEKSVEELMVMVQEKLKDGLKPVDDKIIYSTETKPSAYFLSMLCFLYGFWGVVLHYIL